MCLRNQFDDLRSVMCQSRCASGRVLCFLELGGRQSSLIAQFESPNRPERYSRFFR